MVNKNQKGFAHIILLFLLGTIFIVGLVFWKESQTSSNQAIVCQHDEKICDDGTVVNLEPPLCGFAKCPSFTSIPDIVETIEGAEVIFEFPTSKDSYKKVREELMAKFILPMIDYYIDDRDPVVKIVVRINKFEESYKESPYHIEYNLKGGAKATTGPDLGDSYRRPREWWTPSICSNNEDWTSCDFTDRFAAKYPEIVKTHSEMIENNSQ